MGEGWAAGEGEGVAWEAGGWEEEGLGKGEVEGMVGREERERGLDWGTGREGEKGGEVVEEGLVEEVLVEGSPGQAVGCPVVAGWMLLQ